MTNKLLFCLILACMFILIDVKKPFFRKINKHHGWNFLMFTQQWPPVACLSWKTLDPSHQCNITQDIKSWTIHGIWPSSAHKESPSFCNKSSNFDISEIQEIKPKLYVQWPNLFSNTPEDQLWAHEWNKHGTCAASLPALNTEKKFFTQGLTWSSQYDMLSILEDFGISPSSENPVLPHDIKQAIINKLDVMPLLVCEYFPKIKKYYIFEIEICFDKKLQLRDCPNNALSHSMSEIGAVPCPDETLVWYPEIEHTLQNSCQDNFSSNWFGKLYYTIMTINKYFP